jgi:hypothetical protein
MTRLDESFKKVYKDKSGICHHMMFETKYIEEIFSKVESNHKVPFYEAFLRQVNTKDISGASEYEIYFNYMSQEHPDKIEIRYLKWENVRQLTNSNKNQYESVHWYRRR